MPEELEIRKPVTEVDPEKLEQGRLFLSNNGEELNLGELPPDKFDKFIMDAFKRAGIVLPDRERWPLAHRKEALQAVLPFFDIYER